MRTRVILQGLTLDSSHHRFHELAKDMKYNKGGILAATVSYLKLLKMDQMRSWNMEQKLRAQNAKNRALVNKLQVTRQTLVSL